MKSSAEDKVTAAILRDIDCHEKTVVMTLDQWKAGIKETGMSVRAVSERQEAKVTRILPSHDLKKKATSNGYITEDFGPHLGAGKGSHVKTLPSLDLSDAQMKKVTIDKIRMMHVTDKPSDDVRIHTIKTRPDADQSFFYAPYIPKAFFDQETIDRVRTQIKEDNHNNLVGISAVEEKTIPVSSFQVTTHTNGSVGAVLTGQSTTTVTVPAGSYHVANVLADYGVDYNMSCSSVGAVQGSWNTTVTQAYVDEQVKKCTDDVVDKVDSYLTTQVDNEIAALRRQVMALEAQVKGLIAAQEDRKVFQVEIGRMPEHKVAPYLEQVRSEVQKAKDATLAKFRSNQ
jgi:hypothetical protein